MFPPAWAGGLASGCGPRHSGWAWPVWAHDSGMPSDSIRRLRCGTARTKSEPAELPLNLRRHFLPSLLSQVVRRPSGALTERDKRHGGDERPGPDEDEDGAGEIPLAGARVRRRLARGSVERFLAGALNRVVVPRR